MPKKPPKIQQYGKPIMTPERAKKLKQAARQVLKDKGIAPPKTGPLA